MNCVQVRAPDNILGCNKGAYDPKPLNGLLIYCKALMQRTHVQLKIVILAVLKLHQVLNDCFHTILLTSILVRTTFENDSYSKCTELQ